MAGFEKLAPRTINTIADWKIDVAADKTTIGYLDWLNLREPAPLRIADAFAKDADNAQQAMAETRCNWCGGAGPWCRAYDPIKQAFAPMCKACNVRLDEQADRSYGKNRDATFPMGWHK